ncbi:cell surface protein [Butyrivibrio proteoclasticus B316]|uniref:Cell surface protein n=1 Tax=Butyrivibrio proteoclasticus (strain ATCC 51982 / DSM 14932 / B316) TaxID=515622 RepID=E0RZP3_BUTPB|nr:lectin like domain-containing protein [Butyrivibrio proteoclasticus]ADL35159.1 cell surface protein [Butyrivibrio proteoclasticus B316]
MKLPERTFIFLLIVALCVGTFNIQVSAENDSSESSSCYSTDTVEDDLIFFMDEEEISSGGENFESIDEITDDGDISDINEDISDKKENKSDINENTSDIKEIIPDIDEESLPDDFYTEYPVGGIIDEEPIDERESVYDGQKKVFRTQAILPSEYITPDLPPLRRQTPYGTCWAFADVALAEINLMKKGYMSDPDLSELHLAYFTYNKVTDPLGGTEGDSMNVNTSNILDFGGRIEWGLSTFWKWIGVADETLVPYSMGEQAESEGLDDSLAYEGSVHIVNSYEEPVEKSATRIKTNKHASLKQLIMDHGAIGINYYAYNSMSAATTDEIYNVKTNAYYNPSNPQKTNHAVVVVGWDDSFSKTNFATEAPGDGAFLVRNSWRVGTGTSGDYSYSGYFWMSYYEASLGSYAYAAEFAMAGDYDNNYQYDGGLTYGGLSLNRAANVFCTHAEGGESGELLKAVSLYLLSSNIDYTIDIYTDLTDANDPVSGTHVAEATTKGTTSYAGFYTIELAESVSMAADTLFSVVVTMEKNGSYSAIGLEDSLKYGTATNSPGQSFICSGDNWIDLSSVYSKGNFAIKAYTLNQAYTPGIIDQEPRKTDISELTLERFVNSYEYSGQECRQDKARIYKVEDSKKVYLEEGIDYLVEYSPEDLINGGTKTVTYTGIGDYTGVIEKTYRVLAFNMMKDAEKNNPCISVSFDNVKQPGADGRYSFDYNEDGVYPEPILTFNSGSSSMVLEKDKDYIVKYYNNIEPCESDDTSVLPRITITGKGNFIRSFSVYFYILPKVDSRPSELTVSFDANGAKAGTMANQIYYREEEAKALSTNKYIRSGYVFMGWAASKEDADAYNTTYEDKEILDFETLYRKNKDSEITLYAIWRSEFNITYDTKGGKLPDGVSDHETYKFAVIKELPIPEKEGYRFVGWYTDDTYQTRVYSIKSRTYGDFDLVAKWEIFTYTISYNGNGSTSGKMASQAGEYGTPIVLNSNSFVKKGYSFAGWNLVKVPTEDDPGINYADNATVVFKPEAKGVKYVLYAQWKKNTD